MLHHMTSRQGVADWDPELYNRFRCYRAEPVDAILSRLKLSETERVVDLGCGSGENTVALAQRVKRGRLLGIDSSPAMIERANQLRDTLDPSLKARVRFEPGEIPDFKGDREYSVVFSNAAFHWIRDHRGILRRCYEALTPGGKLVVQMPANDEEVAKVTMRQLANDEPWRAKLAEAEGTLNPVPPPEYYRQLLAEIGFADIDCYYQTFAHPMNNPAEVVEWYKSTGLRPYMQALTESEQHAFIASLIDRLESAYRTAGKMTFHFRRLFLWASRPQASDTRPAIDDASGRSRDIG
jgi:trans-aconitate 2-methyltransferase